MIKNKCRKLTICCTILLLLFSFLSIFVLHLRYMQSDFRVDVLGLRDISSLLSQGMYLRYIETSFKQIITQNRVQNFQLIEMMNETNPNIIANDAILFISASNQLLNGEYLNLIEYIHNSNRENPLPFFIMRRKKNLLFHTNKQIKGQVNDIAEILQYFRQLLLVKKLTIISFEEGSLLTLRSLSYIQHDVFQILDTVILMNPFNPTLSVFLSTPYSFIQETKQLLASDYERMVMLNMTKLLIINTIDENVGDNKKINWLFELDNDEKIMLGNSITISSKFMWNVYSYLKVDEYFSFEPFLWILTKAINENRHHSLTGKDLEYILLFKEMPEEKTMAMSTRRKILNRCTDYYIENYQYDGIMFKQECTRVLRKQNIFFNSNTTFLLSASNKFQVYGESYEKLSPYDTKTDDFIYLLENVGDFKRFFIINRKKIQIRLTIQSMELPKALLPTGLQIQDFFHDLEYRRYYLKDQTKKQIIQACPGFSLLFPYHYGPRNNWDKKVYLQLFNMKSSSCYKATDFLMFWLEEIISNWALGYNLGIFTLYCTHILQTSTFSRFYFQLAINIVLVFLLIGQFLPFENMLLLSIVILIQTFFKLWLWTSELISVPKSLIAKSLWVPILAEFAQYLQPDTFPSPWKILSIQICGLVHKKNIVILFLQILFIWKYLNRDEINLSSLTLVCAWLFISTPSYDNKKKEENKDENKWVDQRQKRIKSMRETILRFRNEFVDVIGICIVGVCIDEDGIILHHITDFYVITYVLFGIHELLDDYA